MRNQLDVVDNVVEVKNERGCKLDDQQSFINSIQNDIASTLTSDNESEYSVKQCFTNNAQMMKMIDNLKLNSQDISGCTVWESTDGCSNQYRCGAILYFFSYVISKYNTKLDRMIGTPTHEKDIVDGINACDKRYLKGKMCMIRKLETDDCSKRIMSHSMIGNAHYSFVEYCKRLYECSDRENGVKCKSQYETRKGEKKLKKTCCNVQKK